ncbi:hypothetical protein ACFOPX_03595 [Helicobacter baculiformis]|uniref:Uncharacterized protein n=1 Tax=Helicobacter baculiformis TaxID=427351 RepID=A0ABV7ZIL2_9HELI|nr:hypothetical protein [Helicobacter baculiformis]
MESKRKVVLELRGPTYKECKKHAKESNVDLETFLASILEEYFYPVPSVETKHLRELQVAMDRIPKALIQMGTVLALQGRFEEAHAILRGLENKILEHLEMAK